MEDAPCESLALLRLAVFHLSYDEDQNPSLGDTSVSRTNNQTEMLVGKGWKLLRDSLKLNEDLMDVIGRSNVLEAMGRQYARFGDRMRAREAWANCVALRKQVHFDAGTVRVNALLQELL